MRNRKPIPLRKFCKKVECADGTYIWIPDPENPEPEENRERRQARNRRKRLRQTLGVKG